MAAPMRTIRVVEFYSGIGGMHYALAASKLNASVVAAVDINDLANKVYKHNFPNGTLMQRNIQSLTKTEFSQFDADIFLMSPPCQPFTRVGLKGDNTDPRTLSFLHVLEMLPNLQKIPSYILIENVKGFETSMTRNQLIQTLENCCYTYEEFLLSPAHFGIPNQRLRYFLLAKQRPLQFTTAQLSDEELSVLLQHRLHDVCSVENASSASHDKDQEVKPIATDSAEVAPDTSEKGEVSLRDLAESIEQLTEDVSATHLADKSLNSDPCHQRQLPDCPHLSSSSECPNPGSGVERTSRCKRTSPAIYDEVDNLKQASQDGKPLLPSRGKDGGTPKRPCSPVADYLEELSAESAERLLLPDKLLQRFARIMDVVTLRETNTRCFTKAYGHYIEGTGSLLQMNTAIEGQPLLKNCHRDVDKISEAELEQLRSLKIRYFSPREIANLHLFPKSFGFPSELTVKQRYRVLGNSLNIHVVEVLLRYLVTELPSQN